MENMEATLPNGHVAPHFRHAASSTVILADSAAVGNLPRRETYGAP